MGPNLAIGMGSIRSLDARLFRPAPLPPAVSGPVPVNRGGSPGVLSRAFARERCFHRLLQPTSVHEHPKPIRLPCRRLFTAADRRGFRLDGAEHLAMPDERVTAPVDAAPRASARRAGSLSRSSMDPPPRRFRPRAESPSSLWHSPWRSELRERPSNHCSRSLLRASTRRSSRAGDCLPPSRNRHAAEATRRFVTVPLTCRARGRRRCLFTARRSRVRG
jgi:hypothetical protein